MAYSSRLSIHSSFPLFLPTHKSKGPRPCPIPNPTNRRRSPAATPTSFPLHGESQLLRCIAMLTCRIRQFDTQYNTFFYINPTTDPPTTSWTHPGLPSGQPAPEQVQALQDATTHGQGQDHGQNQNHGSAVDYMNSASVATPSAQGGHGPGLGGNPGSQGPGVQAGSGERGMGSNMAMNMVMGKLGAKPQGGHGVSVFGGATRSS